MRLLNVNFKITYNILILFWEWNVGEDELLNGSALLFKVKKMHRKEHYLPVNCY